MPRFRGRRVRFGDGHFYVDRYPSKREYMIGELGRYADLRLRGFETRYRELARKRTGNMSRGFLGSTKVDITDNSMTATARTRVPYFPYQEYGFRHYITGRRIPPNRAATRAINSARRRFSLDAQDIMNQVADSGLRGGYVNV